MTLGTRQLSTCRVHTSAASIMRLMMSSIKSSLSLIMSTSRRRRRLFFISSFLRCSIRSKSDTKSLKHAINNKSTLYTTQCANVITVPCCCVYIISYNSTNSVKLSLAAVFNYTDVHCWSTNISRQPVSPSAKH